MNAECAQVVAGTSNRWYAPNVSLKGISMTLNRHVDTDGEQERKRNDTLVRTLRNEYGEELAPEVSPLMQLGTLKDRLVLASDASLNDVLRHYKIKK
jgi:hypothetical protein